MNLELKCDNVSLTYKKFEALQSISFTANIGIYGLIGRNGAGKTSLLSLIASFRRPTSGRITFNGEEPFENANVMASINFIYNTADYDDSNEPIIDEFEAYERYRPHFNMDYAKTLAKKFKLSLDKPVSQLSKGQQAAFGVIRGLASRTPITIFDEVYLSMDAPTRELFYQELLEEQERNPRLFILSTHLISEMEYLFDHILMIDKGQLIIDEPYYELVNRGASITGNQASVDQFVEGMTVLNTKQLGNTKSVMVYNEMDDTKLLEASKLNLEIGQLSLHDLFIHLTKDGESNE